MNPRHRRSPTNLTIRYMYMHIYDTTIAPEGIPMSSTNYNFGPFYSSIVSRPQPPAPNFWMPILFPWNPVPETVEEANDVVAFNSILNRRYRARSDNKFISPFARRVSSGKETINMEFCFLDSDLYNLTNYISKFYWQKWKHLWDLYTADYDPLHSYTVDETRTREVTGTDTGTVGNSGTGSSSKSYPTKSNSSTRQTTPNITETLTGTDRDVVSGETETVTTPDTVTTTRKSEDGTGQNNRFAFNTVAENGVPVTKDTTKITSTDTQEVDGTETVETTDSRTDTLTLSESKVRTGSESESLQSTESYTGAEAKTESASNTETRNLAHGEEETVTSSRAGNMFKSFASLMEDDRNFWMTEYFDIVFDDVDKILTLDIYSESEIHTYVW